MKASDFIVILGSFIIITTSTVYGQEAKDSDLAKQAQVSCRVSEMKMNGVME